MKLGERIRAGSQLAHVSDAFGDERITVKAPFDGLVIGHTNNPLVYQGDAILHLGRPAE